MPHFISRVQQAAALWKELPEKGQFAGSLLGPAVYLWSMSWGRWWECALTKTGDMTRLGGTCHGLKGQAATGDWTSAPQGMQQGQMQNPDRGEEDTLATTDWILAGWRLFYRKWAGMQGMEHEPAVPQQRRVTASCTARTLDSRDKHLLFVTSLAGFVFILQGVLTSKRKQLHEGFLSKHIFGWEQTSEVVNDQFSKLAVKGMIFHSKSMLIKFHHHKIDSNK